MPHATVAVDTLQRVLSHGAAARYEFMHKIAVTTDAGVLEDAGIARLDLDGLVKVHKREALRVPKAVVGLGDVFRDESVRQMAVRASGGLMVSSLLPRIVFIVHDVAVCTGTRILGKVAKPFTIIEGVEAQASCHS